MVEVFGRQNFAVGIKNIQPTLNIMTFGACAL
jgi:hypothetical protein